MISVPRDLKESEQSLYVAAYNKCIELLNNNNEFKETIQEVCLFFSVVIEDTERLERFLFSEISVETEPIVSFISNEKIKNDWWSNLKNDTSFSPQYWTRYKNYLVRKDNWSLKAVDDIDEATNEVMNILSNPLVSVKQETLGLEFGYVQSGKTAHYIGLINKAIDAGYKIIIVLSGIHNNLRSQTQSRIDEEILGYETSLDALMDFQYRKNAIGVGIDKNNQILSIKQMQSLTTRDEKGDFNNKVAGTSMQPPFMIITKKNATVLKKIISYLHKSPFSETNSDRKKYIPAHIPALIIDDEADQASINTRDCFDSQGNLLDNFDPTTINGLIRKLLMIFENRSYVGYTATPYANIFIPTKVAIKDYGNDLYPKDFILRIPRADMYVGAKDFFGLDGDEESPAMPLCRDIIKGKDFLSKGTKPSDFVTDLPDELKKAIKCFLISTAVRNNRGQRNKPNTMLIHIVRYVEQQNSIKKKVQTYLLESLFNRIKYGDEDLQKELQEIWENDYYVTLRNMKTEFPRYMQGITECSWNDVLLEIKKIVQDKEMMVYCINGKSTDSLMYKNHLGKPFNVIVVGGDKLSRGLTLEGLTISYFTRASNTYDTLMQMGRWFGYRTGYLDLCRLFTTRILKGHFYHISMATEDLVSQFDFMRDIKQTPETFGLRMATHPELMISSKNKIRTGIEMKRDFSNNLNQTRTFDIDEIQFENNFFAVESLIKTIGSPKNKEVYWAEKNRKPIGEHFFWTNVSGHAVASFLETYETSKNATRAKSKYMSDYIKNQVHVGGLINWTVCLINVGHDLNRPFEIGGLKVQAGITRKKGCEVFENYCSIKTMTSEGHEYLDYSKFEVENVEFIKKEGIKESKDTVSALIRRKTRNRTKGFLILYPIGDVKGFTDTSELPITPFGFAIVFPDRKGKGTLNAYRYNDVAIERDSYEHNN